MNKNNPAQAENETRLRALEPNDLDLLYSVENSPELWDVSATSVPYSRQFLQDYIFQTTGDIYTDKQLRLVVTHNGEPAGLADLQDFDPRNLRAEVGITILPPFRRRGIATQAIRQLMEYARTTVHLHQVFAYVAADNQASRRLLRKCGFIEVSLLKDWLWNGQTYRDAVFLQCFL